MYLLSIFICPPLDVSIALTCRGGTVICCSAVKNNKFSHTKERTKSEMWTSSNHNNCGIAQLYQRGLSLIR